MIKHHKKIFCMSFQFAFLICIIVFFALSGCKPRKMSKARASQIFRQYILDPIPSSVTNIKVDQTDEIGGYEYVFRFDINKSYIDLLIDSRPFQRVWNVKYKNGSLDWGWDRDGPLGMSKIGYSITIYVTENSQPDWFRLELWDNPETYVFHKEGELVNIEAFESDKKSDGRVTTDVLLYNEKEGEAYCIVSSRK